MGVRSKYVQRYDRSARDIVRDVVVKLALNGPVTYNEVAAELYRLGYSIKLETIKRTVRWLVEEGVLTPCGTTRKRQKRFCLTTEALTIEGPQPSKVHGLRTEHDDLGV